MPSYRREPSKRHHPSLLAFAVAAVLLPAFLGLLLGVELRAGGSKSVFAPAPFQNLPGLAERSCHDGLDDDGDGFVDCDDPDCARRNSCRSLGLNEYVLSNTEAAYRFVRGPFGLGLESVREVSSARTFPVLPAALWRVTLRAPNGDKTDIEPGDLPGVFYFDWQIRPGRAKALTMYWRDLEVDATRRLDVTAHFKLPADSALLQCRIDVSGSLGGASLFEIEFPRFDIPTLGPETKLLYPSRKSGGGLIRTPEAVVRENALAWPTNFQLAMTAYYDEVARAGLYFTCDDGDGWYKRFLLEGRTDSMFLGMENVPSDNLTVTSYSQPYRQRFGPFLGDWFDAATIYREWALEQDWVPEPLETRTDVADSLRHQRLNFLLKAEVPTVPMEFVQILEAYRDRFSLESTIALFRTWDTVGDATGRYPPDHFPPKAGFGQVVAAAQAIQGMTVRVVPDTGSISYDPRTPSYAAENAELYTYKDEDLQPIDRGIFVQMNPCTQYWQDKQSSIRIQQLQLQYGADGGYFDSLVVNRESYDPTHPHPVGGGRYIHECIREMVGNLLAEGRANDPGYFSGEEPPTETLIDLFLFREGYFCVAPLGQAFERHVPLFQAVYHEVAPTVISSRLKREELDDGTYTPLDADIFQAHGFVIGSRLNVVEVVQSETEGAAGWLINRPDMQGHYTYLEKLVEAAGYARKYLTYGRLLRPLETTVTRVDTGLSPACNGLHELPVVESSVWRASDGRVGLVFTNWTDAQQTIPYTLRLADYGLDAGDGLQLYRLTAAGSSVIGSVTGDLVRTETLDAKSVLILEIATGP